jgi:hypothetical protein
MSSAYKGWLNEETLFVAEWFTDTFTREEAEALTVEGYRSKVLDRLFTDDEILDDLVERIERRVQWADLTIRVKNFWRYTPKKQGEEPTEDFLLGFDG